MNAVFDFLRENGFVEAESALREEMIERGGSDDRVGSENSTVRIVLGKMERPESSSSDGSDEFVSMASDVSASSSSSMGLMNPYGLWSVTQIKSREESSDALSDFGTAHDYNNDCEVLSGMQWYEEEDGGYLKQPCFGETDFISYPSEDKFVMTIGAEEQFERPLGLNFSTGGFHSEMSINFLDKPFHHNKCDDTAMIDVNDCPDSAILNESGCKGCKEQYNCSVPLCDCCTGPKGFARGDLKDVDYCHETIEQVKGLEVSIFDFQLKLVDESPATVSQEHNLKCCSDHVTTSVRDNQNLASEFPQVEFPMLNSSATSRRPLKNYDSASDHKSSRSSNNSVKRSFDNNMDDGEVLKESNLHVQSAENASGPDGDGAHETENGRDMVEESCDLESSNELPMYNIHEDEYEIFDLRIIHRKNRTGFEENKDLPIVLNTIVAGRYYVTEYLGSAAFSRVIQAHDLHTGIDVCLKIIKNDKDFFDQSLDEIKLLKFVNKHDPADERHILRLYDYFYHQEHLFIVCELLRANLYEFQKFNQDSDGELYFTLPRLQTITRQCLEALEYLHHLGIIHCDLKPENILIKSYSRCEIKVIDLGSSCFQTDNLCLYVQSRSYRAPEVILGLPYDEKIDIWSLGCILAELCSGDVLFSNDSLVMMLARMIGMLGPIDMEMLEKGQETHKYFTDDYDLYQRNEETNQLEYIIPEKFSLAHRLQVSDLKFVAFVRGLLRTNPRKRPTARESLQHPWLSYQYESTSH